jgi:hypothetical protein
VKEEEEEEKKGSDTNENTRPWKKKCRHMQAAVRTDHGCAIRTDHGCTMSVVINTPIIPVHKSFACVDQRTLFETPRHFYPLGRWRISKMHSKSNSSTTLYPTLSSLPFLFLFFSFSFFLLRFCPPAGATSF